MGFSPPNSLFFAFKQRDSDTISPKRNIPLAGKGERDGVWGEVVTLSIDKRDKPFYILIRHAGDFTFVINRKQCYLNRIIFTLNDIECDNTSSPLLPFPFEAMAIRTLRVPLPKSDP